MKITNLTVELDSGDKILFKQHKEADAGYFSKEAEHPERISHDELKKAEAVVKFIFNSYF